MEWLDLKTALFCASMLCYGAVGLLLWAIHFGPLRGE